MKSYRLLFLYLLLGLIIYTSPLEAVQTVFWNTTSTDQWIEGESDGTSITADGRVVLAPKLEEIFDSEDLYIWSLITDKKDNVYVGTGNNGKIYQLNAKGDSTLWAELPDLEIFALAMDKNGILYAGTSLKGLVYKITAPNDTICFFDSGEDYIWSMQFDNNGDLLLATGSKGKLYRISPNGKGEVIYDSPEQHIMCLTNDNDGNWYFGSAPNAIVYHLSPNGKVFALYDANQQEISSLIKMPNGSLYISAISSMMQFLAPIVRRNDNANSNANNANEEVVPVVPTMTQSMVYEITSEGNPIPHWNLGNETLFEMILDKEENLLLATGNKANLYKVNMETAIPELLAHTKAEQILSLVMNSKGEIYLGTGNMGKVYKLNSTLNTSGTLESKVYDTNCFANWGQLRWKAETSEGTNITFKTRSGNTIEPDETWSEWSAAYRKSTGEPITSPSARYLQWEVTLNGKAKDNNVISPELLDVTIAYVLQNIKPDITKIVFASFGKDAPKGIPAPSNNKKEGDAEAGNSAGTSSKSSYRNIKWNAIDKNQDRLIFDLYYKAENEITWRLLKEDLTTNFHIWDTNTIIDGIYRIKVIVSDRLSNPSKFELSDELISETFIVDNTSPNILNMKSQEKGSGNYTITVHIEDKLSIIDAFYYSIDGEKWQPLFPNDNIFDSSKETFSFYISDLEKGEHSVIVWVSDDCANNAIDKVILNVK